MSTPVWSHHKWAVRLAGEPVDLQEASELFRNGAAIVRSGVLPERHAEPHAKVLLAEEFESLQAIEDVHNAAERILNLVNAILYLEDPVRRPLTISSIHRRGENGAWGVAIIAASAHITLRGVKAYAHAGSLGSPEPPPPQSKWIETGLKDDDVANVLSYLRGVPDWIELYRAYEAMNSDVNVHLSSKGPISAWPSKAKISEFTRDAQLHRHSKPWCDKAGIGSAGAMSLNDASALVRSMIRAWIEWRG
jgi:hypothetical protein